MNIVFERPPNYAEIVAELPFVAKKRGVYFCWGNTIFNPDRAHIDHWLMQHERVHSIRQQALGPRAWWNRYLATAQFRFDEELPAHRMEYRALGGQFSRNQRRQMLRGIAGRLAGPLYGNLVSVHEAKRLIAGSEAE